MEFVKTRSLDKGQKLFHEKDMSNEVYFIRVGTLLVLKGEILVGQVKPPNFIGELGPVLNMPRSTTVMAKTPVSLDVYDGREIMTKFTLQTDTGIKFLRSLSERLDMTRERLNEYQYLVIAECLKILAVHVSERKIVEKKLQYTEIKAVRREIEVVIEQAVSRHDAVEDFAALQKLSRQYNVKEKYDQGVAVRFKSFAPMDLKPFKAQRPDSFTDFKTAAQDSAEKIVVLTRYLADFQKLGLGHLDSELTLIEETLAFAVREQILKELLLAVYAKGSLEDFKRQVTEFDRAVKSLAEETGHADMPLGPIAKRFGLDQPYMAALQAKWREFLVK